MKKKKSRDLGKDAAVLTGAALREGPEESIKNNDEEVLGGSCIKGKFYKYSNWLLNKSWSNKPLLSLKNWKQQSWMYGI